MSLEKLIIHPFNIASLYQKSLVLSKNISTIENNTTLPFKYLGKNNKLVTIIIEDEENLHISDIDLAFLTSLLNACKLSLNDVSIINVSKQKIDILQIQQHLNTKYLLIFGVTSTLLEIPMVFPEYHIHNFSETQILLSHKLTELQKNIAYKKQLWDCLKKMFSI